MEYVWSNCNFWLDLKEYLPALVNFCKKEISNENLAKDLENMVPKFYSGDFCLDTEKRGFYLILEDLSSQYSMNTEAAGFKVFIQDQCIF